MTNSKVPATLWAVQKLAGALLLDIELSDGRKIIAKRPILYVRKEQHNRRNNLLKHKYLRPTVYVKSHIHE
jgi:hypothetical protein